MNYKSAESCPCCGCKEVYVNLSYVSGSAAPDAQITCTQCKMASPKLPLTEARDWWNAVPYGPSVELPKGRDGKQINIGDEVYYGVSRTPLKVQDMTLTLSGWYVSAVSGAVHEKHFESMFTHERPDSMTDIKSDLRDLVMNWRSGDLDKAVDELFERIEKVTGND